MRPSACLIFTSIALSAAAAPEPVFKFQVPAGWLDLSPGAPEENFTQVAPEATAIARSGRFAAYAFDIAGATESFTANENVRVQDAAIQIDQATLPRIRADLQQAASSGGTPVTVIDASLRRIGSAQAARFVADMNIKGTAVRQITYLIPAAHQTATLVFTVERSRFDDYVDRIDIAAMKTEGAGAASPAPRAIDWSQVTIAAIVCAALCGLLFRYLQRPRKV